MLMVLMGAPAPEPLVSSPHPPDAAQALGAGGNGAHSLRRLKYVHRGGGKAPQAMG